MDILAGAAPFVPAAEGKIPAIPGTEGTSLETEPQAALPGTGQATDDAGPEQGAMTEVDELEFISVEAHQARGCTQPDVAVAGLCDGVDGGGRQGDFKPPSVAILF